MPNFIPSIESVLRRATDLFIAEFESTPEIAAYGPGRVNLIGEHTDYNEGFVLPIALPFVTVVAGRVNGINEVRLHTGTDDVDPPHKVKFSLSSPIQAGKPNWANYVKGVIAKFKEGPVPGFDAVIVSSVPTGGGVSSSAALEVGMYTFLEALVGKQTTNGIEKALACQEAENLYAGVPCGIMDQLAAIFGMENHALFLDCGTLEGNYVPIDDPHVIFLIINSNVKHQLVESEYAIRRKNCQEVANLLGKKSLRYATESDLLNLEKKGVNKTLISRARHVITENRRTQEGVLALKNKDYEKFGKLMVESHISLRDDFEVSCKELDELVQAAIEVTGVFGSRMTGGGFGGCTVTLLKKDVVDACISNIKLRYSGDPIFYICKPSAGAKPLTIISSLKTA